MGEHQPRDDNGRFVSPDQSVSVERHIDRIFQEKQVALDQRFAASESALRNARESAEKALTQAREHIEAIFEEHRTAHRAQHLATEEAVKQARETIDARLEKLNELRSEVTQDRGQYVRKETLDIRMKPIEEFKTRATLVGTGLALVAGSIGAIIGRLIG